MTIKDFLEEFTNRLLNSLAYLIRPHKKIIRICSWVNVQKGKVCVRNLGDELNIYLLNEITDYNVRFYNRYFHIPRKNYLIIGSIIENFSYSNSIIWGSGALYGIPGSLKVKPHKITAVRGKLTRDFLLGEGVDCPEVYGDPALLCPYVYKPIIKKKWRIGFIPHIYDLNIDVVIKLLQSEEIHLIRMDNYQNWKDVIDEIVSCDVILSSSLHGLILSDAYKVPNVWISFSNSNERSYFKYLDYYSSINRVVKEPLLVSDIKSLQYAVDFVESSYQEILFDPAPLIKSCPFNLNKCLVIRQDNENFNSNSCL